MVTSRLAAMGVQERGLCNVKVDPVTSLTPTSCGYQVWDCMLYVHDYQWGLKSCKSREMSASGKGGSVQVGEGYRNMGGV